MFLRNHKTPMIGVRSKKMLLYPEGKKLEELLEELFSDDNELASDDITVLSWSDPIILPFGNCCKYNYTNYGG